MFNHVNRLLATLGLASMLYTGAYSQGFMPEKNFENNKMVVPMPPEKTYRIDDIVNRGFRNSGIETPDEIKWLLKYYATFSTIILNLRETKENVTCYNFKITDGFSCKVTYIRFSWERFNEIRNWEILADFKFDL
jgi:hypothetical protein